MNKSKGDFSSLPNDAKCYYTTWNSKDGDRHSHVRLGLSWPPTDPPFGGGGG